MANQVIIDETRNQISVIEGQTRIIEVAAQGPQGPVGPRGEAGPSGSSILNQITSGSVTASVDIGSAAFTVTRESNNLFNVGSSGNVGIGLTSLNAKLHVSGSTILAGDTTIQGNQFNAGTYWRSVSGSNLPSGPWRGVAYGNGLFVAIASRGGAGISTTQSIATSPDGVNWTFRTLPSLTSLINVTYQNGIFVAVGHLSQRSFYSYDGINWFNGIGMFGQGYGITYGKDKFVATKIDNSLNRIDISYNGVNWQGVSTPSTMDLSWTSVTYANDRYVAVAESTVSGSIAISYDGITWNNVTRPLAGTTTTYNICYGKGLFVITCNQGKILTSPDGINWTARDTPLTGLIWKCIFAEGIFIAAGAFSSTQNRFIYSTDGITWQEASTPALNDWGGFAYGNGLLLAVTYNGTDSSALVASSGVMNSFVTQNDNITHGRQIFTDNVILSGSLNVIGSQNITGPLNVTGSLLVTGNITAQTLVVQTITSSVLYSSGSNIFGNSLTNTQQFTGSVTVTGSSVSFNGSSGFNWDGVNNRLGIGTNAPSYNLDVTGTVRIGNNTNGYIFNSNTISTFGNIFLSIQGDRFFSITDSSYNSVYFRVIRNTGNVLINSTTDTGERLQVSGSSRFTGNMLISGSDNTSANNSLTIRDSTGTNMFVFRNDGRFGIMTSTPAYRFDCNGSGRIPILYVDSIYANAGTISYIAAGATTLNQHVFQTSAAQNPTSGNATLVNITGTFSPTSGTATYSGLQVLSTINQTGTANGITRGLYVNPTITSASDFRAIEWTNNAATAPSASWGLYGSGSAPNYLSGSLLIGSASNSGESLQVYGTMKVNGITTINNAVTIGTPSTGGTQLVIQGSFTTRLSIRTSSTLDGFSGTILNSAIDYTNNDLIIASKAVGTTSNIFVLPSTYTYMAGNVLIGTTSNSGERLQVSGSSRFGGNMTITGSATITAGVGVSGASTFTIGSGANFILNGAVGGQLVYSYAEFFGSTYVAGFSGGNVGLRGTNSVILGNTATTYPFVIASDRVAIGHLSPTALLHVSGSTGGLFEIDSNTLANILYVSSSGNVGIGTNAPAAQLNIIGPNAGSGTLKINTVNRTNGLQFNWLDTPNVGEIWYYGETRFRRNSTELNLVLSNSGNVILGTNIDSGERLQVIGSARITDGLVVSGSISEFVKFVSTAGTARLKIDSVTGSPNAGFGLAANGVTKWSLASYGATSDFTFYNEALISDALFIKGSTNNVLIGTTSDTGQRFQVSGSSRFDGSAIISGSLSMRTLGSTSATNALTIQNSATTTLLSIRNDGFIDAASAVGYRFSNDTAFSSINNGSFVTGYRSVATGNYSFSANGGMAGIGGRNQALGNMSAAFGRNSIAYLTGQFAHSSYGLGEGLSQHSFIQLIRDITGTSIQELFIDNSSAKATLPVANSMWIAKIYVIAVCRVAGGTTVLGDIFVGEYLTTIKRIGATTSIVGSISTDEKSDTSMSTSVVTIDADTVNNAIRIRFTPPTTSDGTTAIRAVATLHLTELRY
jgi:hypothetical protein